MNIRGAPLLDRDTVQLRASQLKLVCEHSVNPVLAVLDREYGNASWVLALTQASIQADCLMRVRKNA
ncbi:MAG: hypothetical protein JGK13_32450 [Microcoleus sp. PH2017_37_MFU_D_B]|uniref:hypothetical protein n=1 Tax=Microcoleus sp. PH2017_37_MFU_D_B TaxID=2798847 RepID=UPI001DBDA225|nr:hypothetical protein [Microcoleus sp. PH2017_37_MFU_D_B]MCC3638993.1 hypothetical protein [Microcoleus sp. PH2017_37_MFU_D_B]